MNGDDAALLWRVIRMAELEELHADLIAGDLRAASKIVEYALPKMLRLVKRLVPKLHDGHEDACLEALLDYLQKPADFVSERANLLTYLVNQARSRARTAVRAQTRRQTYEHAVAVDRDITVGDRTAGEDFALDRIHLQHLLEEHGSAICADPDDGELFLLMAAGERFYPAYLEVLGLDDTVENRAEVERRRERIRGRLRRLHPQLQS
jgi:DNA-directed RNA polymerase specialized sigma24 family protein